MFTAFSSALSALTGHTTAVDVVGNNLANLNTIGFKRSEVSFYDLLSRTLGASGQTQVGMGVGRPFTSRQFNQGAIQTTSGRLDAAIQGEGFFVVKDANGGIMYTRAGNFKKTADGMMVTATGERVQGWVADVDGNVTSTGAVGDIRLPEGSLRPASATENLFLTMNLNAADNPGAQSLFRVPVRTYDSLGNELIVTMNYEKTGPNTWQMWADALDPAVGTIVPDDTAKVDLAFDSFGSLIEINGVDQTTDPPPNTTVELNLTGLASGASDFDVQVNFFAPTGAPLVSQFAQPSAIAGLVQDGQPAAQLSRVAVGDNGVLLAQYSDGTENIIGQLALASVGNPETLVAVGNNAFRVSANSAEPVIGAAGTGGRGTIVGGATEASSADMAREFTNLIVYQRGYQANARVITTADELSAETINLKR
ncbi:MAG: flagellar hook protein FlgE [Bryobacterales bacterium]|jgi:flagellar hook protein FlgE|nr:flagellar hook protein FlgE [Bryobacterales bacterium]